MHPASIYQMDGTDSVCAHIRLHPFAMLAVNASASPIIAMVPLVLNSEEDCLIGHVSRRNPLASLKEQDLAATAVFQGPHAYISPSWYPSKDIDGRAVPTWNYIAAEVRGVLRIERDVEELNPYLNSLSQQMEDGRENPWRLSDAPEDYLARLRRGIVGLSLRITEMNGVKKLSQDDTQDDFNGVVRGLMSETDPAAHAVADEMLKMGIY